MPRWFKNNRWGRRASLVIPVLQVILILLCLTGCSRQAPIPRPYGYYRIAVPTSEYRDTVYGPYAFELSRYATLSPHLEPGEVYWMDIIYPTLNTKIYCSYKPIHGNLDALTRDALEFIYKHAGQASAIPEHGFENPDKRVYGVFFTLEGNTASPYQFFLTDSTRHFFRGAVYCNCRPNVDSLRPILDFMEHDITHLIETFQWTR